MPTGLEQPTGALLVAGTGTNDNSFRTYSQRSIGLSAVPLHRWRTSAMLVGATLIMVIGLFWGTAVSVVATWYQSSTYSHGFLVLPISLYLIWTRRHAVASLLPVPNPWGFAVLAVLGFGWMLGNLGDVLVVQQLALVAMLPALVGTVLGTAVARALLFPLAFLFFAVPMGQSLVPPLQDFTAFFAVKALELSRIPVVLEGRFLSIPTGTWEVAEACSGVRYLIASVTLGCLYAAVVYRSRARRLGFFLASVVVPMLANGIRAYVIIVLAHVTNNRIAAGVDHLIYGWLFFGMVMFLLFALGWRWRELGDRRSVEGTGRLESSTVPSPAVIKTETGRSWPARVVALTAASAVALLGLGPIAAHVLSNRPGSPKSIQAATPRVTPPWEPLKEYTGNWVPRFLGADAEVMQSYTSGVQQVHFYMAYYASQREGAELINWANVLVDGKQWLWVAEDQTSAVVDGRPLSVHETLMRSAYRTRLVWSWYWVAGEFTTNPYRAKLLHAKARLLGGPQGAAVIALGADYDLDQAEAADALQNFLHHTTLLPTLDSFAN